MTSTVEEPRRQALRERYVRALRAWLGKPGEQAREEAYQVGREALGIGLGPLEVVSLHQEVLEEVGQEAWREAGEFLLEVLAPYEMVHAGYRETIERLEAMVSERTADLERKAGELERSNAELAEFAYIASHDLKEPLRMVTSFGQLLERRLAGHLPPDAEEYLSFVMEGAARMRELVDALLALSQVEKPTAAPTPVSLDECLDEALTNLELGVRAADAAVIRAPLGVVGGYRRLLVQVFQDLIANALKFRGEGPLEIRVEGRRVGDEVEVIVRDNGIGIDPASHQRVFEMFRRLNPRDAYQGVGIGLAMVRRIVERHGGRIWVESTPGRGAAFHFTLPAGGGR